MPGLPIGPLELLLILAIALLIFGPGKLPDVGSAMGKTIREFRKASSDLQDAADLSPRPPAPASSSTSTQLPVANEVQDGAQDDVTPRGTPSDPKAHAS